MSLAVAGSVDEIARVGDFDGPTLDEALRMFARLRTTPEEGRAVERLLERDARDPLPEPLLLAVASALADRGQPGAAEHALSRATSGAALILRADLLARAGSLTSAVALVERVLLRDIDAPGARERHTRWREALGVLPARRPIAAGATIVTSTPDAPFRLFREVARGGAGTVYEAEDRELGRRVALKVYHHPERDRAQLLHEARVAVTLAGVGVVRVFDVDPFHGWLAIEWTKLGDLRGLIQATALAARVSSPPPSGASTSRASSPPPPSVPAASLTSIGPLATWAVPLAAALARVHAAGWVHLDVKPANVLLRAPAEPLLTDFATARLAGEPSPPGSLGYVSPERLAGAPSDPRDDVYGFGRILEDALDARQDAGEDRRWRPLAAACTGPVGGRPRDGGEIGRRAVPGG